MDAQKIISGLLSIVLGGVTWWTSTIWQASQKQQDQLNTLAVELAKNYAPRVEMQVTLDRIFNKLDEIQREVKK